MGLLGEARLVTARIIAAAALSVATSFASEARCQIAGREPSRLKHGDRPGRIALWAHVETDAYFGPITVTAR
jgi:hypothetical protein